MDDIEKTKNMAKQYGLKFKDHGGGHIQLENHGVQVNYYPNSKKRTAYVKGGDSVPHCSPFDAIRLCMQSGKPGLKPKKKKITRNPPPETTLQSVKTNPMGLKHFYSGDTPPWETEPPFRFNHPSDELRAVAYVYEQKAERIRVTATEIEGVAAP